jgi:hypothetical protein
LVLAFLTGLKEPAVFMKELAKNSQFARSVCDQFLDFFLENWGYVSEWVLGFLRTVVIQP